MATKRTVTLHLPDDLYESVQEVAEASDRPLESVLIESLDMLFRHSSAPDFEAELAALPGYPAEQLWAIVYRHTPWIEMMRRRELDTKARASRLNEEEQRELDDLLERIDRRTLLRSEALLILKQRGQNVSPQPIKMSILRP